ncbi:Hypothetical predicted protein [Cloeon dipterum]|uniref:Peptidase S1 domain-containing protein n=1 Tax=Cloeon dipterum TaxID=197152 RepID=A0A8S1DYC5_9INSE|nr:Hypothetical predicted protein [Cloeon dipterum]
MLLGVLVLVLFLASQGSSRQQCQRHIDDYKSGLERGELCALQKVENKSPCKGDSGATLVVEANGVFKASSARTVKNIDGGKLCNTYYPAIFTDAAAYRR